MKISCSGRISNLAQSKRRCMRHTLSQAISALVEGPKIAGVKPREDIGPAIHTLHVARLGRKGRHFVVFKCTGNSSIDVLRLLHDSMDLPQHDLGE